MTGQDRTRRTSQGDKAGLIFTGTYLKEAMSSTAALKKMRSAVEKNSSASTNPATLSSCTYHHEARSKRLRRAMGENINHTHVVNQ